jgi:hypothetical protein
MMEVLLEGLSLVASIGYNSVKGESREFIPESDGSAVVAGNQVIEVLKVPFFLLKITRKPARYWRASFSIVGRRQPDAVRFLFGTYGCNFHRLGSVTFHFCDASAGSS